MEIKYVKSIKQSKHRENSHKKPNCNNFNDVGYRESVVKRAQFILSLFPRCEPEKWISLDLNADYEVSSWGRVKHLKSWNGKSRIIQCTIKYNKYPFFTITFENKRKGISLVKFINSFNKNF